MGFSHLLFSWLCFLRDLLKIVTKSLEICCCKFQDYPMQLPLPGESRSLHRAASENWTDKEIRQKEPTRGRAVRHRESVNGGRACNASPPEGANPAYEKNTHLDKKKCGLHNAKKYKIICTDVLKDVWVHNSPVRCD